MKRPGVAGVNSLHIGQIENVHRNDKKCMSLVPYGRTVAVLIVTLGKSETYKETMKEKLLWPYLGQTNKIIRFR